MCEGQKVFHPIIKGECVGTGQCAGGAGGASPRLQEGAEGVVHGGQVQVLRLAAAVRLHPRLSFLLHLFALVGERPPPADGALGATLQTRQDHFGQILLESLEVLPETAQTRVRRWRLLGARAPVKGSAAAGSMMRFGFQLQKISTGCSSLCCCLTARRFQVQFQALCQLPRGPGHRKTMVINKTRCLEAVEPTPGPQSVDFQLLSTV